MRHHPGCLHCFVNYINDIDDHYNVVALPTGAVAKYCDEYVCACVCVIYMYVCPRSYFQNHTRLLYHFGTCCLWPWLGLFPMGWRNPKRKGQFLGFSSQLTMHCTAQHLGHILKRLNRSRCRLRWVGLAQGTVRYVGVMIPEGEPAILGKHVPDKALKSLRIANWTGPSSSVHTTGADTWLQALEEPIIGRKGGLHTAGEVWYLRLPCFVWFQLHHF